MLPCKSALEIQQFDAGWSWLQSKQSKFATVEGFQVFNHQLANECSED